MPKVSNTTIDTLIPDDRNFNKGTPYGNSLIGKSLENYGAGRSVLLDKDNKIIAGNKTIENAAAIGLDNVIIVETTGDQIVAVKRTDISINSKKGREMALADNATSKANLEWDEAVIAEEIAKFDIDASDWGLVFGDIENVNLDFEESSKKEKVCPHCGGKL